MDRSDKSVGAALSLYFPCVWWTKALPFIRLVDQLDPISYRGNLAMPRSTTQTELYVVVSLITSKPSTRIDSVDQL